MSDSTDDESGALGRLHADSGVSEWSEVGGCRVPARFGRTRDEYEAIDEGTGLLDRTVYDVIELTGADRHRFLSGLVTCAVENMEEGEIRYGFFTSVKGRILADVVILSVPDRLLLELPPGRGEVIADHLRKYRIADRVEIEPATIVPLTLLGGVDATEPLGREVPGEAWRIRFDSLEAPWAAVDRRPVLGLDAVTCWTDPDRAPSLWRHLADEALPVGWDAVEIHRVERGRPRFGTDFGPDVFPQETGLEEEAVSYEKGCYLGQEVVARIHYRGRVNRLIVGLLVDGEEVPPPGAAVSEGGRSAGEITSSVRSPALDRPVALGLVHARAGDPGTLVELEGGVSAEVTRLPFVG